MNIPSPPEVCTTTPDHPGAYYSTVIFSILGSFSQEYRKIYIFIDMVNNYNSHTHPQSMAGDAEDAGDAEAAGVGPSPGQELPAWRQPL